MTLNSVAQNQKPRSLTEGQKAVEGMAVAIDWLSLTFPEDLDRVLLVASLALGCEREDWVELDCGSYGYRQGLVGPGGARVWWDAPGREDVHVSFPGQACGIAGEERIRSYLRAAIEAEGKATRIDLALDDYRRIVAPANVLEALQGPDRVTHAKQYLTQQGGVVGSRELTGATVYLGAPSSRQRLRIYDKGLESQGETDCIRWELQSRKEAAETLVADLAHRGWGEVAAGRLVGFVDFRDAAAHSEVEKRPRLTWFKELVGWARKASAYLPKAARTVEQAVEWVSRSVGPTLAVVMHFWGGDLGKLTNILREGEKNWRPKHRAMLAGLS